LQHSPARGALSELMNAATAMGVTAVAPSLISSCDMGDFMNVRGKANGKHSVRIYNRSTKLFRHLGTVGTLSESVTMHNEAVESIGGDLLVYGDAHRRFDEDTAAALNRPRKRKARRALTSDQKTKVCGIGGCESAYGSAQALCRHRRAHHPGWKVAREKQQALETEAAAATGPFVVTCAETDQDASLDKVFTILTDLGGGKSYTTNASVGKRKQSGGRTRSRVHGKGLVCASGSLKWRNVAECGETGTDGSLKKLNVVKLGQTAERVTGDALVAIAAEAHGAARNPPLEQELEVRTTSEGCRLSFSCFVI